MLLCHSVSNALNKHPRFTLTSPDDTAAGLMLVHAWPSTTADAPETAAKANIAL